MSGFRPPRQPRQVLWSRFIWGVCHFPLQLRNSPQTKRDFCAFQTQTKRGIGGADSETLSATTCRMFDVRSNPDKYDGRVLSGVCHILLAAAAITPDKTCLFENLYPRQKRGIWGADSGMLSVTTCRIFDVCGDPDKYDGRVLSGVYHFPLTAANISPDKTCPLRFFKPRQNVALGVRTQTFC